MKVRRKSEIAEAVQWDGTAQTILGVTLQDYREGMWVLKNDWLVKIDGLPTAIYRPDAFAAHYEPVPEPSAPEEDSGGALRFIKVSSPPDGDFEQFSAPPDMNTQSLRTHDGVLMFPLSKRLMADMNKAIASYDIPEITRIYYQMFPDDLRYAAPSVSEEQPAVFSAETRFKIGEAMDIAQGTIPAPHRATIALIPCSDCVAQRIPGWRVLRDSEPVEIKPGYCCGIEAEAKAKIESLRGENNG